MTIIELLRRPAGAFGVAVVVLLLGAAALSLVWTPYPLLAEDVSRGWSGPSAEHWLGTDRIGRDTASWLLAGARTSVIVAAGSALFATVIGITLGAFTSLTARWVAEPLVVLIDVVIAFPTLLLAMLIASGFGGSLLVVVVAVSIAGGVGIARVIRPELRVAERADYVLAARAAGVRPGRVLLRHIVPAVTPVVLVQVSLVAAGSILAEAGLSYLGYGAPSGTPSWGRSLADSQQYIAVVPTAVLWPGLTITITVLGLFLLGDALREALDPRLRRSSAGQDADRAEPTTTADADGAPADHHAVALAAGGRA